jgi:hypothetical protein
VHGVSITTRDEELVSCTQDESSYQRRLIEARWESKPLAFAGKLQPRRLIK